jgi:hypothetical protein
VDFVISDAPTGKDGGGWSEQIADGKGRFEEPVGSRLLSE